MLLLLQRWQGQGVRVEPQGSATPPLWLQEPMVSAAAAVAARQAAC
jgi:hypothetical protein